MPAGTTALKPAKMPAKRRRQHDCAWVLAKLLVRQGAAHGNLVQMVSTKQPQIEYRETHTGSSVAFIAKNGILMERTESQEDASR